MTFLFQFNAILKKRILFGCRSSLACCFLSRSCRRMFSCLRFSFQSCRTPISSTRSFMARSKVVAATESILRMLTVSSFSTHHLPSRKGFDSETIRNRYQHLLCQCEGSPYGGDCGIDRLLNWTAEDNQEAAYPIMQLPQTAIVTCL